MAVLWFGNGKNAAAAIVIPYAPGFSEAAAANSLEGYVSETEKPEKPSKEELEASLAASKNRRRLASSVLIPHRLDTMPFVSFDPQMF